MFFLLPCPHLLIFIFMSKIQTFAFPVIPGKLGKIRELVEDLSQLLSAGHPKPWTKTGFPLTVSTKKNKDEEFQTVINVILQVCHVVIVLPDPLSPKTENPTVKGRYEIWY